MIEIFKKKLFTFIFIQNPSYNYFTQDNLHYNFKIINKNLWIFKNRYFYCFQVNFKELLAPIKSFALLIILKFILPNNYFISKYLNVDYIDYYYS